MTGAQAAFVAAVVAALTGDEAVQAVLGDPVRVWDQPPKSVVFPYVQVGRCESQALRGDAGAVEHQLVLTCVSRFAGMEEARALAAVVEAVLGTVVLEEGVLVSCQVRGVEVLRSGDLSRAWAVMRIRAVTDLG